VIEFDEASENMGIMHKVDGVDIEKAKAGELFGLRVKAVWKKQREREGSVTDIIHFKPLTGEG
ncbi:MAG: DNA-binding protein, partial [Promethearchaeota archaeon]